jgi:hypothetical protein
MIEKTQGAKPTPQGLQQARPVAKAGGPVAVENSGQGKAKPKHDLAWRGE